MAFRRKRIGLIYEYDENWIGGTYYIENLVSALNLLPGKQKPELYIFTDEISSYKRLADKVNYPLLHHRFYSKKLKFLQRLVNKVSRRLLFYRNIFLPYHRNIQLIFPVLNEMKSKFRSRQKMLYWIPDLQEHFYPEFFSENEIAWRKENQQYILKNARYIIFSSKTVEKHFEKFYPENKLEKFVVPFAVTHPVAEHEVDLSAYGLPEFYFICCNQFWKHKNHVVVLEAIKYLKQLGHHFYVLFTGKEHDYRNPDYFSYLVDLTDTLGIKENIRFLGFIERQHQLALIRRSVAVVQPSLFEGWSTVLEDAKATGAAIISSDIEVHKEQLETYPLKSFFAPQDAQELAGRMLGYMKQSRIKEDYNYEVDVTAFAGSFNKVLNAVLD